MHREISVRASEEVKQLSADARQIHERTDLLIKYVSLVSSAFLGIVALIVGTFLAIGWRELRLVSGAREAVANAKTEVDRARDAAAEAARMTAAGAEAVRATEQEVNIVSARVRAIDRENVATITDLGAMFNELLTYEAERNILDIDLPDFPSKIVAARHEEADIVLVLADKTNAVEKAKLVDVFITLGIYWRIVRNYPRAVARFARALEIDPRAARAHAGLCVTYYTLACDARWQARQKATLLGLADASCDALMEITPDDPDAWFHRGWIADERHDFETAVRAYSRARELDPEGESYVMFNMACSYSRWGRQSDAFVALGEVIHVDNNWDDAERDPNLQALRDDPEYGPRLAELVRQARAATRAPKP
jgi:tetratricopeptide (TPR) repeat protein